MSGEAFRKAVRQEIDLATQAMNLRDARRVEGSYLSAEPIGAVTIPLRTVSELNSHEHWRYRQKRAKAQHVAVEYGLFCDGVLRKPALPVHVHMTRLAPGKLDTDNLAGAFKHVRDATAKYLGVDDGDESKVTWSVGQEKSKAYQVRIEFYRRQK